tara:strand:+ start:1547 stop:3217 length:1671 start_codon:yes stop_codon:yes gene_type:complete
VNNIIKKIYFSNYSLVTQIIIINLLTAVLGFLFLFLFNYLLLSSSENIDNQISRISNDLNQTTNYLKNNAIIRVPQFNEEYCENLNDQSDNECGDIILSNPQLDPTSTQRYLLDNYLNDQNTVKVYDDSWIKFADTGDIYISSDVIEVDIEEPTKKGSLYDEYKYNYLKYYNFLQESFSKSKIYSKIKKYKGDIFLVKETIKEQSNLSYIYLNDNNSAIIINSKPIIKDNNIYGVVLVSGPLIRENNDTGLISFNLINLFIIIICIMFFLSILFSQSIVSPITTLSKIVRLTRDKSSKLDKKIIYPKRKDEIGILSDDIQSMLEDLKKRIDEIEGFAADVSHELKNPIASLKSSNELLLDNKISAEKKLLLKQNMKKDIERMNTLINDISVYTLTQVEIDDALFYNFNFSDFLNDLLKSYQSNTKKIKINFEYDKKETYIYANKDQFARVFINLIDNSISYSPMESEILIKMKNLKDAVSIIIVDQGPGIEENLWIKVFDRFYTDRKSDQDKKHSGLGLSISKKIIESFSGSLQLTNFKSKKYFGACFEINLPLKD